MKKNPDKKVIIPALLFLPIIAGILLFLALAAVADDGRPQEKCAQGTWPESDKRVYAGVYKDLSLMRKLKARSMLFAAPSLLGTMAIAYEFPYTEVIGKVQGGDGWDAFADMILRGKVAFAKREANTLNLVVSPDAFQAWATDKGSVIEAVARTEEEGEAGAENAEQMLQAWKTAWDTYSKDTRTVDWIALEIMNENEDIALAEPWKDIVLLSGQEAILGVCNEGRVITWDGAKPLPDIDVVAQELDTAQ